MLSESSSIVEYMFFCILYVDALDIKQIKQSSSNTLYQHFLICCKFWFRMCRKLEFQLRGGGGGGAKPVFIQTGIWRNQNFILGFAKLEFGQTDILGFVLPGGGDLSLRPT